MSFWHSILISLQVPQTLNNFLTCFVTHFTDILTGSLETAPGAGLALEISMIQEQIQLNAGKVPAVQKLNEYTVFA